MSTQKVTLLEHEHWTSLKLSLCNLCNFLNSIWSIANQEYLQSFDKKKINPDGVQEIFQQLEVFSIIPVEDNEFRKFLAKCL